MPKPKRRPESRWTDYPFRKPNTPPEQLAFLEKRDEAMRIFYATGDDTMLIELGLFPEKKDS